MNPPPAQQQHRSKSKIPLRSATGTTKIPLTPMITTSLLRKDKKTNIDLSIREIERLCLGNKHSKAICILRSISPAPFSKEGPPSIDPRWSLNFWSLRKELQAFDPSSFPDNILLQWKKESLKFLTPSQQFEIFSNNNDISSFKRQMISMDSVGSLTPPPPQLTLSYSESDLTDFSTVAPPEITLSTSPPPLTLTPPHQNLSLSPPTISLSISLPSIYQQSPLKQDQSQPQRQKGSTYLYELMSPKKKDAFVSPVRRSIRKLEEEKEYEDRQRLHQKSSQIPRKRILFERLDEIPNLTTFIPNLSVQGEMMDSPKKKNMKRN